MSFKIIRPYKLAEMLDCHRATIHRMEKRGQLPPRKQFSQKLIGWEETVILDWLDTRDKDISETQESAK